jgi:hypothetical protein
MVNGKSVGKHTGGYDPFTFDITDALAKDKQKPLRIELTNDDGSVWKTITISGVNAKPNKGTASSSMTIKGSKILIN